MYIILHVKIKRQVKYMYEYAFIIPLAETDYLGFIFSVSNLVKNSPFLNLILANIPSTVVVCI